MVLLVSVLGAFVIAYALSLTIGGLYVPFVMPLVVGFLLGAIAAFISKRFDVVQRRPVILAAILGAIIAYVGYHVLAYLRTMDTLAAQWGVGTADAALALIEEQNGKSGFLAYFAFVSEGQAARLSPLGLLGRGDPGLTVSIIVSIVELALTIGATTVAMLWRTRATAPPKFYAPIDPDAFAAFKTALARLDWGDAGAALATTRGHASHAVIIEESSGATSIEAYVLDARGVMRERVERRMVGEAQAKQLNDGYTTALTRGARP